MSFCRSLRLAATAIAAGFLFAEASLGAQPAPVDLSGTWLPDARRAEPWPDALPLAPAALKFMKTFDATQSDPVTFCMPFGTPRNMLQTGYPLEIVQTPQRFVFIVQPNLANSEVRRIAMDGVALPAEPEPSWFGVSRGHWEGATLVVETIGLREDSLISENGLPHSAQLRVVERLQIAGDSASGKVLIDDIELHDPQAFVEPLKTRRYFSWAPQARSADSTCVDARWIDRLWRDRLQEHADAARQGQGKP